MSMLGQALTHFLLVAVVLYGAVGLLTAVIVGWRQADANNNNASEDDHV